MKIDIEKFKLKHGKGNFVHRYRATPQLRCPDSQRFMDFCEKNEIVASRLIRELIVRFLAEHDKP